MLITKKKKYIFTLLLGMYFASGASVIASGIQYEQLDDSDSITLVAPSNKVFNSVPTSIPFDDSAGDDLYVKLKVKRTSGSFVHSINILVNASGIQCYFFQGSSADDTAIPMDGNYHDWVTGPWSNAGDPAGDCGPIGTGWHMEFYNIASGLTLDYKTASGDTEPWIQMSDDSSFTPAGSSVTILNPTAMTYTGNPVPFSGTYTNVDSFDRIQFDLVFNGNMNMLFTAVTLPPVNGSDLPWSASRPLVYAGPYTVRARLYDTVTGSTTPWTATTTFALNSTSTNPAFLPDTPVATEECSSLDLICYGKQLFSWAFFPSVESVDQFKSLYTDLEDKFPFVYLYQVGDLREELFGATETGSSTISVTIRDYEFTFISKEQLEAVPYASTIKTILGWLMWFFLIETIYRQVLRMHNKETV